MKYVSLYLILLLISGSGYAVSLSCDEIVHNLKIQGSGQDIIRDKQSLVQVLRYLNKYNTLPKEYVTRRQAVSMGWSGNSEDSLWTVWSLNKKKIGGDLWEKNTLQEPGLWYSADIDSERGFRSHHHLLFNPDYSHRYIVTSSGLILATIAMCQ